MFLRVAGAQIPVKYDISSNLKAINRAIDYAISVKADILLTPEGSLSGYHGNFDPVEMKSALKSVVEKAAKNSLGLALGTCCYEEDKKCYNQIRFYSNDGNLIGFHSKILRCGNPGDLAHGEIEVYSTKPLEVFRFNEVKIGGLICNDLWANPEWTPMDDPHLTRQLSHLGAKVIFHSVNSGTGEGEYFRAVKNYHESNLQIRAKADNLYIVTVNNCYPMELDCSCSSGIISPDGKWLVKAPDRREQYFVHTIEVK